MKIYSKYRHLYFSILISFVFCILTSCAAFKYKPVDAREVSPDPKERVKKNIEEGRGFRIMGGLNKGGTFDFASSNPLWRATLDTIDFMPLISANYSGGIVITDWYSESGNEEESIKISVRFVSNEIRTDALNIKVFIKNCDQNQNCIINESQGNLKNELRSNILKRAAKYKKEGIELYKKNNPYDNAQLDDKDGN